MNLNDSDSYTIRPAGRHLLTIGRELIQNSSAAVVELVKNAYDADSANVEICFTANTDLSGYTVTITDHGHGMSRDTVITKWMVPSTRDKLERKNSPNGRVMQGRKGVGRYAASVLGTDLLLETVSTNGEKTTVFIEWNNFDKAEYLDDVEILIESSFSNEATGTKLTITGDELNIMEWDEEQFKKLRFELKKLISPVESTDNNRFEISLIITGFTHVPDVDEVIKPYPIFDLFDYRISGNIGSDGHGVLNYSIQKVKNSIDDIIPINLGRPTECGDLIFDIRVYDRDPDAITSLINRGLKDEVGNYVGKNQARDLLNAFNGIGVYRNGFRIRPLGDVDFDWLKLNVRRVQNPSMRISSNQVIGHVLIQSEEQSKLIEKSARDGLRENDAYQHLKDVTQLVIGKLEERRFSYRKKAGLGRTALKVENALEKIFSFETLRNEIRKSLINNGIGQSAADEVIILINREEEEKAHAADDIRRAVATYQGQATLGKIINVVLHEGRRPLNYFKNEVPRISRLRNKFIENHEQNKIDEIMEITKGVESNASVLSDLFKRLDPLAAGRRAAPETLNLKNEILNSFAIFRQEMDSHGISFEINCDSSLTFQAWSQDIQAIFANLIDNSIFWLKEFNSERKITVNVKSDNNEISYIDFKDTGPGIEPYLILEGLIFEPQFSTKPSGSGIGLAIAGEASERNKLILSALESSSGAYFRLQQMDIEND
ncbi:ATP-binding protein [Aeromonas veronii]|uniref:ATP-binding protein n=1 Tax=Aeromonas veronii TaxID=654 RepID=UPI003D1B1EE2